MKTLQTITKQFTIERMVHSIMIVFALASVGNVSSYLQSHGHHWLTSYALGIALGGVLVASAMLLADVDYEHEIGRFAFMGGIVLAVGLLSGTIQTWAYASHDGMDMSNARLMGYGLPLLCEGALAVFVSVYGATRRRKNIRMATEGTAEQVASAVAEALADVDVTKVRRYVEKRIDGLTRAIVDQTIDGLMPVVAESALETHSAVTPAVTDVSTDVTPTVTQRPIVNAEEAVFVQQMADGKRTKSEMRRADLLHILQSEFDGADAGDLNKSALAGRLDVTRQTVSRDINQLVESGRISLNGTVKVSG